MYQSYFKRGLDVFISTVLLVLFSPIMVLICIAIKLDSQGSIIFKQQRSGKGGTFFMLYKFRSMVKYNNVHDLTCEDKITRVGKFLRKTSMDELPQLWNIIKGEMSFIGPRPWIVDYQTYFTDDQHRRLEVKPGITGLAQCSGRNDISIKEKIDLDIYYVEHLTFKMDLKIFFKTIVAVVTGKGLTSNKNAIQRELSELRGQWEELKPYHSNHNKKAKNEEKVPV